MRGIIQNPLAVPEKICVSLPRLSLIFFDRCAFLNSLHPPTAGTPNALKFASGNPFGGANKIYPLAVPEKICVSLPRLYLIFSTAALSSLCLIRPRRRKARLPIAQMDRVSDSDSDG